MRYPGLDDLIRRSLEEDIGYGDIHAVAAIFKPAQHGVGGGDAEMVGGDADDVAIVAHVARFVAPGGVEDLADAAAAHVAGDGAVEHGFGVGAGDVVFEEGGDVYDPGGVADGPVFALEGKFVHGGAEVAGPVAPAMAFAQGGGAGVKGCWNWHTNLVDCCWLAVYQSGGEVTML